MKKQFQIAVRSLVEHLMRTGDLSSTFDLSQRAGALNGNRAHQKIQKSRSQPYAIEIPVSYRRETDEFILNIQGRIDGLYEQDGLVAIEEIKSTPSDLDEFIESNNTLHWAQVKAYAAMFVIEKDLERISTQLTCTNTKTGEVKTFFQEFRSEELRIFLSALIDRYLEWISKVETYHESRNRSILNSDFPFDSFRNGQRQMVEDVFMTLQQEDQMIIQAPTGTGKTVGVIYPALKALGRGSIEKIFYLTSRTTGRLIAEQTLAEVINSGMRVKSVSLTAKEKICFNPDKMCHGDECEFAAGYYDRITEARETLFEVDVFTSEKIISLAQKFRICPFEFSLDLALWVDCIICDVNYVFDPRVYLKRFFLERSLDCTFLIDEAHNLVDRSREMFSAIIRKSDFLKVRRLIKNNNTEVVKIAGEINSKLLGIKHDLGEEDHACRKDCPEELLPLLKRFVESVEAWVSSHLGHPLILRLLDHYFRAIWFLKVSQMYDENYVTCLEKDERDFTVKLFCIDPSEKLREAFAKANSAVLFSATMTPMSYFAQMLGLRETVGKRIYPSPFPQENLCLLVSNSVSTLYRHRNQTKESLVETIGTLVDAKKGNYMIYFPSYDYLRMVMPLYAEVYPDHRILVQTPEMSEEDRIIFLENFSEENHSTLVGFVVMGGIFGEAVDLVGDRLTGAVIVGVGLPGISLERELIRYHFSEHQIPGFDYAYRFPGMIRVLQAAGRVIRTETDRGAILLIDTRYLQSSYRTLFPQEWKVRAVRNTRQMNLVLHDFWSKIS
jgi:DNA excision repair protein ERCC-2